jgi:hypothetical protein
MTCVRHMALWLVAVIVLIAVGVMPSDARAHAGHPHTPAGVATAEPGPTALPVASLSSAVLASAAFETRIVVPAIAVRTIVVLAAAPVRALSAGPCDGTCCNAGCRSPGSCCTGAGLAPDSADAAGPRGASERALARALPARTDVVPEALPEPPRYHA